MQQTLRGLALLMACHSTEASTVTPVQKVVELLNGMLAKGLAEKKRRKLTGITMKRDPRSKNIFFKLLGHLHSAKEKLESDVGSKKKLLKAKAPVAQLRQARKEPPTRGEDIKALEKKELVALRRRLETHYSCMMNYIRTKAEPTIFYLPKKHSPETESKLEETRDALKHKIVSLKAQLRVAGEGSDDEASSSGDEDWMSSFPEGTLQQVVRNGLTATSTAVTTDRTGKALVVEYEGGSYGQGRHSGLVQLSDEELRIYDRRYPGRHLVCYEDLPTDPEALLWCLRSPNWDFAY